MVDLGGIETVTVLPHCPAEKIREAPGVRGALRPLGAFGILATTLARPRPWPNTVA